MNTYCPECSRTFERSGGICPHDETELRAVDGSDDPFLGTVLDERYRLEARLGGGGMGVVYRARQLAVDRDVAVKVLRSETDDAEAAHRRFNQEARHISALSHPNIVQLIDFGRDDEREIWFLVMEHVQGESLRSLLSRGPVNYELALEVTYQVCAALTESHRRETVHRDLKPANLHLKPVADGTLQVKVLDFGIARCVERAGQWGRSEKICGSPAYMAPEQAQGDEVGPRADFYALGVILYEMLTDELPFRAEGPMQYMYKTSTEDFPSLAETLPSTEAREQVDALLAELVAKEPESRPAEAREVRRRVESIREELGLPLHRMSTEIRNVEGLYDMVDPAASSERRVEGVAVAGDPNVSPSTATQAFPTLNVTSVGVEIPETVDIRPVSAEPSATTAVHSGEQTVEPSEEAFDADPSGESDDEELPRAAQSSALVETAESEPSVGAGRWRWVALISIVAGGTAIAAFWSTERESVESAPRGASSPTEPTSSERAERIDRGSSAVAAPVRESRAEVSTGLREFESGSDFEFERATPDAGEVGNRGSASRERKRVGPVRSPGVDERRRKEVSDDEGSGDPQPRRSNESERKGSGSSERSAESSPRREPQPKETSSERSDDSSDSLRQMLKNGTLRDER